MYRDEMCLVPFPYGGQPLSSQAYHDTRSAGEGDSEFGDGKSERSTKMTKFEVISVQGGYIIRYWLAKELKMKMEVYPTASELMERLDILISNMEEE